MKKPAAVPPLPPMTLERIFTPNFVDEIEDARKSWRRSQCLKRFFAWSMFAFICGATGISWAAMIVGPERLEKVFDVASHGDGFVGGTKAGGYTPSTAEPAPPSSSSSQTPEPSGLVLAGIGVLAASGPAIRRRWRARTAVNR